MALGTTGNGVVFFDGAVFVPITDGMNLETVAGPQINQQGHIVFIGITVDPHRADMFFFDGSSIRNLSIDPTLISRT
jgi:hypothetical protein